MRLLSQIGAPVRFSVTLEHSVRPPITLKGDASDDPSRALGRALRLVEEANPRYKWDSLVVVLDRLPNRPTSAQ